MNVLNINKHKKRKPFGTSSGNALILKKKGGDPPTQKSKSRRGIGTSTRTEKNNNKQNHQHPTALKQKKPAPKAKRDSKTPRTSNLTAAAGAYNLKDFGLERQHKLTKKPTTLTSAAAGQHKTITKTTSAPIAAAGARGQSYRPKSSKPDPSPIKRPDPSSSKHNSKESNKRAASKSTKDNIGGTKTKHKHDGFVAASLKRIFSTKESTSKKQHHRTRPTDPSDDNDMETKTACSTPEQHQQQQKDPYSPLITSPLNKPDPIAKGDDKPAEKKRDDKSRNKIVKKHVVVCQSNNIEQPEQQQPKVVPKKVVFDQARYGPTDNKHVLEAMLKSGSNHHVGKKQPSDESLVGLIIGGASLKRADSADESEVTTLDYQVEDVSETSMTTRISATEGLGSCNVQHRHHNHHQPHQMAAATAPPPTKQKNSSVSDIFRASSAPSNTNTNSNFHQELRRANTITSQATATKEIQQPASSVVQLPSGWKQRWSKTKQKPYYVHPDFGSTWHCPGLKPITNKQRDELFNVDAVTSQRVESNRGASFHANNNQSTHFPSTTSNTAAAAEDAGVAYKGLDTTTTTKMNPTVASPTETSSKLYSQDFEVSSSYERANAEMELAVQRAKERLIQDEEEEHGTEENNSFDPLEEQYSYSHDQEETDGTVEFSNNDQGGFDFDHDELDEDATANTNSPAPSLDDDVIPSPIASSPDLLSSQHNDTEQEDSITDDDRTSSLLSTIHEDQNEMNSLASDHVDVDALLQKKLAAASPMPTIKELRMDSAQSKQSSQVSPDDDDDINNASYNDDNDELNRLYLDQKDSFSKQDSFETLSRGSDEDDDDDTTANNNSVSNNNEAQQLVEQEDDFDDQSSPMLFDNNDNGGFDDDDDNDDDDSAAGGGQLESLERQSSKSRRKKSGGLITGLNLDAALKKESRKQPHRNRGPQKKIFPPGPLCSLQFLEEIQSKEFDTPLWRRMKRKRSTLESVARGKAIKKEQRRASRA